MLNNSIPQSGGKMLKAALEYAMEGWAVIPLHTPTPYGKCSCKNPNCKNQGKHPRIRNWQNNGSTSPDQIRKWWKQWPDANIGLVTGEQNQIFVLDVDPGHGGDVSLDRLTDEHGDLPETPRQQTGSGGEHYVFQLPKGVKIRNKVELNGLPGLDVRGNGGMIVVEPSRSVKGSYEWYIEEELTTVAPAPAPEWLVKLVSQGDRQKRQEAGRLPEKIKEGARRNALVSLAGTLRRRGVHPDAILESLRATNEKQMEEPLEDSEVVHVWENCNWPAENPISAAPEAPAKPPKKFATTDVGNAERLAYYFGDRFRYVQAWKQFVVWDGKRWTPDETGEVQRLAVETVKQIANEAKMEEEQEKRAQLWKHAGASESANKISAMVGLVRSHRAIAATPKDFDSEKTHWLLNFQNGTLDLETGELRPHSREDMITAVSPYDYDPSADCPRFKKLLSETFGGDTQTIRELQKMAGKTLTGEYSGAEWAFLYGDGGTGKTTLLNILSRALGGDYAYQAPISAFMKQRFRTNNPAAADMQGKRMVIAVEPGPDERFDEGEMKRLTGGEDVTDRNLYEKNKTMSPTWTIWLASNHKPDVKDHTDAFWRRMFPFEFHYKPERQDKTLVRRILKEEAPGVLAWMVEGCRIWQKEDLTKTRDMIAFLEEYRHETDLVAQFLEDRCIMGPGRKEAQSSLYPAFMFFCQEAGLAQQEILKKRAFFDDLKRKGFPKPRKSNGQRVIDGLQLKTDEMIKEVAATRE